MKTNDQILNTIISLLKLSPLNDLNGGIYKKVRPTDSKSTDVVVNLLSGGFSKFENKGKLIVKVCVPNIINGITSYEDTKNTAIIEQLLIDFSNKILTTNNDISFYVETREIYTEASFEKDISNVILRINYNSI